MKDEVKNDKGPPSGAVESALAEEALGEMPAADPAAKPIGLGRPERVGSEWMLDGKPLKDRRGNRFEAGVHVVDDAGIPVLTKKRQLTRKSGARSKATSGAPPAAESPRSIPPGGAPGQDAGAPPPVTPISDHEQEYRTLAVMTTVMLETAARSAGGDHWKMKTRDPNEREMIENAFAEYYRVRDVRNIPPEVALFGALMMWAGPRIDWAALRERARKALERRRWIAARPVPEELEEPEKSNSSEESGPIFSLQ